jgi:hypothetical protein
LFAQDGVIGGVEEVSVEQALRQAVTAVGRAHLVAELLESLALGRITREMTLREGPAVRRASVIMCWWPGRSGNGRPW